MTNSDDYNALPIETRKICGSVITEMRIQQLNMEKARLKRRFNQSIAEIIGHIKNLKESLRRKR